MTDITQPLPNNPQVKKDAFIFISSIGKQWAEQSLDVIARKIAKELELFAKDTHWQFVTEIRDENLGDEDTDPDGKIKVCTISKRKSRTDKPIPVIDLFELAYREEMTGKFRDSRLITKSFYVMATVLRNLPRVLRAFLTTTYKGESALKKAQGLYTIGIFFLVSSYMIILLFAAAGLALQAFGISTANIQAPTQIAQVFSSLILLITFVGAFSRDDLREFISGAAIDYVCMLDYLDYGINKRAVVGKLELLIDRIAQRWGDEYANYHIISYSFGSIVALDTLFPSGEQPDLKAPPTSGFPTTELIKQISTLITIGSPFDLVRTYWPRYYNPRIVTNPKRRWINIYSPIDLLGSNFRDDERKEQADKSFIYNLPALDQGPKPTASYAFEQSADGSQIVFEELISLAALRVHRRYWDADSPTEKNCFSMIVPLMYPNVDSLGTVPVAANGSGNHEQITDSVH